MSGNCVEALKIMGSRPIQRTISSLAASHGLGTPAKAGPPRVVSLKPRISLSDLLSSTLVFANKKTTFSGGFVIGDASWSAMRKPIISKNGPLQ